MSTAAIIILFFTTLAAIGILFFVQSRERNRIERARRLAAAEDAFRHGLRLLDELPPTYLSKELRHTVLAHLEVIASRLKSLRSTLDADAKLARTRASLEQAPAGPETVLQINAPDVSRNLKSLLESLFRLVEKQHKTGKLPAAEARKQLTHILYLGVLTQASLNMTLAQQEAEQGNLRKAINQYRQAATEMGKAKDHAGASKVIETCRARIQELEKRADPAATKKSAQGSPDKSRLDEQLDELIHDEEAWKKRSDFES
ncbi:hypothetical protein [Hydrocarboniclastica marina]|uniref:DNA repair protein n=1 Tax=Hydrocarboniclastica marina TaxID=2259620 RepID=A0A4P7XHF0_9ALTE|nr:hypothetical protein [Hydrocarboniclastica marina]MAL98600.1 hypothetical protein [Alteromonadaceae bacterium]QCF25652.1 hypothetical protein soil367_06835 [Hydrocarboniclastica marina]